jgi:hypothetical protein
MIPAGLVLLLAGCGEPDPGPCDGRTAHGYLAAGFGGYLDGGAVAVTLAITPDRSVDAWNVDLDVDATNGMPEPCALAVFASDVPPAAPSAPFDPALPPPDEDPDLGRRVASVLVSEGWSSEAADTGTYGAPLADGVWRDRVEVATGPAAPLWVTVVACERTALSLAVDVWSCDQRLEDRVTADQR